jgi:hypothetical protein
LSVGKTIFKEIGRERERVRGKRKRESKRDIERREEKERRERESVGRVLRDWLGSVLGPGLPDTGSGWFARGRSGLEWCLKD